MIDRVRCRTEIAVVVDSIGNDYLNKCASLLCAPGQEVSPLIEPVLLTEDSPLLRHLENWRVDMA